MLDQYDALHKSETATQRNLTAEEKEALSQAYAVCQIKPAVLEENIGDYAALSVATLK